MVGSTYDRLTAGGRGDSFDRHVLACAVAVALQEDQVPLTEALGLAREPLQELCAAYFAPARWLLRSLPRDAGTGADALEEPDLRQLLLDHRSLGKPEEAWLAAILARRAVRPNHLWQDMGLPGRDDLNRMLHRHFRPLAIQNGKDMKWKKFFYRSLCEREGILICKAPNCAVCCDVDVCFGDEAGEPLSTLQPALSGSRQSRPTVLNPPRRLPAIARHIRGLVSGTMLAELFFEAALPREGASRWWHLRKRRWTSFVN